MAKPNTRIVQRHGDDGWVGAQRFPCLLEVPRHRGAVEAKVRGDLRHRLPRLVERHPRPPAACGGSDESATVEWWRTGGGQRCRSGTPCVRQAPPFAGAWPAGCTCRLCSVPRHTSWRSPCRSSHGRGGRPPAARCLAARTAPGGCAA